MINLGTIKEKEMIPNNVKDAVKYLTECDPKTKALNDIDGYIKGRIEKRKELRTILENLPRMNTVAEKLVTEQIIPLWRNHPTYHVKERSIGTGQRTSSSLPKDYQVSALQVSCKDGLIVFDLSVKYPSHGTLPIPKSLRKNYGYAVRCKNPTKREAMLTHIAKHIVAECKLADGEFLLPTIHVHRGDFGRAAPFTFSVSAYLAGFKYPYSLELNDLAKKRKCIDDEIKQVEDDIKKFDDCIPTVVKRMLDELNHHSMSGMHPFFMGFPFGQY